ncbi:MAG TPA: CPBP family intramembrane glutamic endopeptidase [Hanamia sp.]|nr:CPBP family intramembrane glutamic endopeptidase [Hanamia sp.]
MKKRILILWLIWTLLGAVLIFEVASSGSKKTIMSVIAMVISASPLLGLALALGSPKASQQFKDWLGENANSIFYTTGGITFLFALPGLLTNTFNPYTTTIFGCIVFAVFSSLKKLSSESFEFSWNDVALWILLWIPFDLRWSMEMHPLLGYNWWALAISVIAVIGWKGYRNAEIGFNLVPKLKDLYITLLALLMIMVVLVPPGLLTGFLTFAVPEKFNGAKAAAQFIGIFLTIALPEELFFRGILLNGLEKVSSKKWIPIVVSSLAFGLMHWNNVSGLNTQITYVILATLAGFGYAWAYKKSGNKLLAAILTHTLVDWIWRLVLSG